MTAEVTDRHRPLAGGIAIMPQAGEAHRGTLTAVARRTSDNAKVLVTNVHVVSNPPTATPYTLLGTESIYQ